MTPRLRADLRPNRIARALEARRSASQPIVDLTQSNPTRAGFDYPCDLLAPLADPRGLVYVPAPLGLPEGRRAVAREYARRGVEVDPEAIALTASTSDAYSLLFKLLTSPGDEILVPRPSYPLFDHLAALDGVVPRAYELEYHGAWSIDFDSVERAVGPRTRAVLMVNPNNPTGSFVTEGELTRLAGLSAPRGIALVADEVFADYPLDAAVPPGGASPLTRDDVLVFALGGLSKSVGLPQLKLGWMAVAGPRPLVSQSMARLEVVSDTYLSVATPVQLAAAALLERGAPIRSQIAARVRANYRRLVELVGAAPSCRLLRADAGWYAVLQVPTFESEEELVVNLLTEEGVLVHPGYFFDFPRESFLILSLLPPGRTFLEGAERVLSHVANKA